MASFYEGDGDMEVAAEPVGPAGADPAPPVPAPAAAAGKINIVGGANDDDDSDEEEGQSFFAGGSTHSGTNVRFTFKVIIIIIFCDCRFWVQTRRK